MRVKSKYQVQTVWHLGETENGLEGNGVTPQGMMSLRSPALPGFKASDASTKLSSEQHQ